MRDDIRDEFRSIGFKVRAFPLRMIIMLIMGLQVGLIGVVIWAIIKLVIHFTQ